MAFPVDRSQRLISLCRADASSHGVSILILATARIRLSGEKESATGSPLNFLNVSTLSPLFTFHSFTSPAEITASILPSGEKNGRSRRRYQYAGEVLDPSSNLTFVFPFRTSS